MDSTLKCPPGQRPEKPQLIVSWESGRGRLWSNLRAILSRPTAPKSFSSSYFAGVPVHFPAPVRAIAVSVLCHLALIYCPLPIAIASRPRIHPNLSQVEITWTGPIHDFPLINPKRPGKAEPRRSLERQPAEAFHPRQTIRSEPSWTAGGLRIPRHPRQTLIRPDAPLLPPKLLPQLPNIVRWVDPPEPVKPTLRIPTEALAKLRPMKPRMRPLPDMALPDMPKLEKQVADLAVAVRSTPVPKPSLPVPSAPRLGPRPKGDASAAPDLRPTVAGNDASVGRLIALSAAPGPSTPNLPLPSGNLLSRIAVSPQSPQPTEADGRPTGVPSHLSAPTGERKSGTGPPGIAISGGNPTSTEATSSIGKPVITGSVGARMKTEPAALASSRTAPLPGFGGIKPGTAPEQIFGQKRVHTLHVNMPNLSSVAGSWILSFVELAQEEDLSRAAGDAPDLSGPVPLRKVDPKYPPALASARVQGEVVLYAIIRQDGSVDSIQLVKGLDPQLDTNAMEALARWKFRPAERKGVPVELEAIVHIPFRAVAPAF